MVWWDVVGHYLFFLLQPLGNLGSHLAVFILAIAAASTIGAEVHKLGKIDET